MCRLHGSIKVSDPCVEGDLIQAIEDHLKTRGM